MLVNSRASVVHGKIFEVFLILLFIQSAIYNFMNFNSKLACFPKHVGLKRLLCNWVRIKLWIEEHTQAYNGLYIPQNDLELFHMYFL